MIPLLLAINFIICPQNTHPLMRAEEVCPPTREDRYCDCSEYMTWTYPEDKLPFVDYFVIIRNGVEVGMIIRRPCAKGNDCFHTPFVWYFWKDVPFKVAGGGVRSYVVKACNIYGCSPDSRIVKYILPTATGN